MTTYGICDRALSTGAGLPPGLRPVQRAIPVRDEVLLATLEALLAGPTPDEVEAGLSSFFSADTADALLADPTITDGVVEIDLEAATIEGLENVGTSEGGLYFRGQVYATLFEFDDVTAVSVHLDGDETAFCLLMQDAPDCNPLTRKEWTEQIGSPIEEG